MQKYIKMLLEIFRFTTKYFLRNFWYLLCNIKKNPRIILPSKTIFQIERSSEHLNNCNLIKCQNQKCLKQNSLFDNVNGKLIKINEAVSAIKKKKKTN